MKDMRTYFFAIVTFALLTGAFGCDKKGPVSNESAKSDVAKKEKTPDQPARDNNAAPKDNLYTYIYNAPESELDRRYDYQWEILKIALERTKDKYGPYEMKTSVPMSEKRQSSELKRATGKLTVMYLDATFEREKQLLPIRIPVDKNLVGYRVFLIRKETQRKFDSIATLDDLRKLSQGVGLGWLDVDILEANKFTVVVGSDYEGLFQMLDDKRFDVFSRGANEIIDEYEQRKTVIKSLHIEEKVLLYFPLPMYFWFSKTDDGQRLAKRAYEGMMSMIEDGTYDKIFIEYFGDRIDKLKLKQRKVFRINNPLLGPETPLNDTRLWFDPLSD